MPNLDKIVKKIIVCHHQANRDPEPGNKFSPSTQAVSKSPVDPGGLHPVLFLKMIVKKAIVKNYFKK
jgi:hypothetical protein